MLYSETENLNIDIIINKQDLQGGRSSSQSNMFNKKLNISNKSIHLELQTEIIEQIKGGFPRIKICDEEFIKKITERKPREFNSKNIISIKEMISHKKSNIINILDRDYGLDSKLNIVYNNSDYDKINGFDIDIISKKYNKKLKNKIYNIL